MLIMKQIKLNILFISFLFSFIGCYERQKTKVSAKNDSDYYNLIYSIAFGQADLLCNTCETEQHYEAVKESLKTYERKIEDDSLGIVMKFHWFKYHFDEKGPYKEGLDENGGIFPIKICYIESSSKNFQYAFALNDGYYYYLLYNDSFAITNKRLKETLKYKIVLENQLNYIINELGINKKEKLEYLRRFIKIFFVRLQKGVEITKEHNINRLLGLYRSHKSNMCSENIEINIKQMSNDLQQNVAQYFFLPFDELESNIFWRIEIVEKESKLKLKVVLHNVECL